MKFVLGLLILSTTLFAHETFKFRAEMYCMLDKSAATALYMDKGDILVFNETDIDGLSINCTAETVVYDNIATGETLSFDFNGKISCSDFADQCLEEKAPIVFNFNHLSGVVEKVVFPQDK